MISDSEYHNLVDQHTMVKTELPSFGRKKTLFDIIIITSLTQCHMVREWWGCQVWWELDEYM